MTTTSLRTAPTVLALAATVLAVAALIVAVVALQGSATAAPTPEATGADPKPCAPIRIAPDEPITRSDAVAEAVAAVRLAAPNQAVEVLDLTRVREADVRVRFSEGLGAYYGQHPTIRLYVPQDSGSALWLSEAIREHLPGCGAEEVAVR